MLKTIYSKCLAYKRYFIPFNLLLLMVYLCQMLIPYVFSHFIDLITKAPEQVVFIKTVMQIAGLSLVLVFSSYYKNLLSTKITMRVENKLLNQVDRKLEHLPMIVINKHTAAGLNQRLFNDVITCVDFSVNNLVEALIRIMSTLVIFSLLLKINVWMVLILSVALAINVLGILVFNKLLYKRGYEVRDKHSDYYSKHHDRLESIKETKIHAWYDISDKPFNKSFRGFLEKSLVVTRIMGLLDNVGVIASNLTLILTVIIGGNLLIKGQLTIGELILMTTYTSMCLANTEVFLKLGQGYQHANICYTRLLEFIDQADEHNGDESLPVIESIHIKNLSFSYPDQENLYKGLDMKLKKGKTYAIKGQNGQGKSTLIDILLGLNYAYSGQILINEKDIKTLDMRGLRKDKISVVMQEPNIQNMSIDDNLIRGLKEYSELHKSKLIDTFKLDEIMDNDAKSLSGGEKQKVSVIRALLKSSDLIILDEPVSAMDTMSIEILKRSLKSIKDHKIILLISHNDSLDELVDGYLDLSHKNQAIS